MTKYKLILLLLATAAMAGCVTTEQMPDGTTKIRFSDEAVSSLTSMMPNALVTGVAGGAGGEAVNLIPTISPLGTGEPLYLNGRFELQCASALLYSAKSGRPLDAQISNRCRSSYFLRQEQLRMAGKSYDRGAPAYDPSNPPNEYWSTVVSRTVNQLAAKDKFTARFAGYPRIESGGGITISVRLLGNPRGLTLHWRPRQRVRRLFWMMRGSSWVCASVRHVSVTRSWMLSRAMRCSHIAKLLIKGPGHRALMQVRTRAMRYCSRLHPWGARTAPGSSRLLRDSA